jgi:hypothetical protein
MITSTVVNLTIRPRKSIHRSDRSEIDAAALDGNDPVRVNLQALHRSLTVLLNVSGLLAHLLEQPRTTPVVLAEDGLGRVPALGLVFMVGEPLGALD